MHPNEAIAVKDGDVAPDFDLVNTDGTRFVLSEKTAVSPRLWVALQVVVGGIGNCPKGREVDGSNRVNAR